MASEAFLVLQSIHDELANHPPEVVGALTLTDDVLSACDGKMRLKAIVHNDPGAHPDIAHAHVIAEVGFGAHAPQLDACVVGINSQRQAAVADTGRTWMAAAAGPIFSLVHAKPVLGASHFSGSEPWGIANCHGFVGPLIARFLDKEADLSRLQNAFVFDYADKLAPPGLVHLAKVTLDGANEDAECFVPIALGRVVFGDIGVRFSPDFMRINRDSTTSNLRLMRQSVYARATVLANSLFAGKLVDAAKSLALTSPETRAINSRLHAGNQPQNLQLSRPVVAEYGIAPAELEKAIDQLRQRKSGEQRATKADKPWWRFW